MKVLYLIDTLQTGGAEKSLLSITKRFKDITPIFWVIYEGEHALLDKFLEAGIIVRTWSFSVSCSVGTIAQHLKEHLAKLKPDIVHASLFRSEMISRKLKGDFLLVNSFVNNSYHWRRYSKLSLRSIFPLLSVYLRDYMTSSKVDYWVSNSDYLGKVHQTALGVPSHKIVTIPRGRSWQEFVPKKQRPPSGNVFISVGRLISRKGHMELLKAFSFVLGKYPTSQLWLVGDGPERDKLKDLAVELKISHSVTFWGNSNHVPKLLLEADFLVFPSHYEGLPGVLIEAMLSKLPIIASAIPENESCVPLKYGLWFEVFKWKDMAKKMKEAIESDNWEVKINKAYNYAINVFDVESVSLQYEEAYKLFFKIHYQKK